ncbi:DUF11 domain-containing protein [Agromyces mediolanus]|uniref:DUF11 domain-containing protein n=1 Tax=Agromyces mediolanus TaxID=41986 RepID=A0A918CCU4_AGRME|nr:DUF11 domain-containing protein [Agromyces mediolanus]GGR17165.1 hypothetical protein GCM10010196_07420 [Agromyces mediolanus]GLJ71646.1 hypothetical protein GCM10017583_09020 [Agromyces mediolanus]
MAGAAAVALLAPALSATAAFASPAPDAEPTTISAAGAFSQTVPDGVCSVRVTVAGAPGGMAIIAGGGGPGGSVSPNGAGGAITATLAVGAGSVLTGTVGGAGADGGTGGAPGGGESGTGQHRGGGGGGYSELSAGGALLLLAGGGGGTGGGHTAEFGQGGDGGSELGAGVAVAGGTVFPGGDGMQGQDTGVGETPATAPGGGAGGSAVGGAAGTNPRSQTDAELPGFDWNGKPGSERQGGAGGDDNSADTGGAGGGGYFGGGGGAATDGDVGSGGASFVGGGGGGGSSFAADSALIGSGSVALATNRDSDGEALAGHVTFDWVMCEYDLAVTKAVVGDAVFEDGATVRYAVTVTNAGPDDMAIGDTVSLVDELATGGTLISVDGLGASVPAVGEEIPADGIQAYDLVDLGIPDAPAAQRGLPAGATVEFVYETTVTGTEDVTNIVTVTDRGDQSNNRAEATVVPAAPSLALTKSADTERATKVGQQITYTFVVTNTGNIEVRDVAIEEQEFDGAGTLPQPSCEDTVLAAGDRTTCTSVYTVVAADLTGGALRNTAIASGTTPLGAAVESAESAAELLTVKPQLPAKAALADTGVDEGLGLIAGGAALLLLLGLGLLVIRRFSPKSS